MQYLGEVSYSKIGECSFVCEQDLIFNQTFNSSLNMVEIFNCPLFNIIDGERSRFNLHTCNAQVPMHAVVVLTYWYSFD